MKTYKRSIEQIKILEGMDKVYEKLIEFKKKINGEVVILVNDEMVKIKPS